MSPSKKPAPQKRTAAEENDANIMATNDSSIMSKRSAEILYSDEPHFIRYFVKQKKKSRSPLISRGYWLRMKAIETVVCRFLQGSEGRKVVINLGAGYDALPFELLAKKAELCSDAVFVDVDYPELLRRKYHMIQDTPAIMDLLGELTLSPNDDVPLRSEHYILAGCDLNRPEQLKRFTSQFSEGTQYLFIAEVSICYMETEQANSVIQLTATIPHAQFCILEQFIPRGPYYPFAKTMLAHFRKVKGELKSIHKYQSLHQQEERFRGLGWTSAQAKSLWQLWSDSSFVSKESREDLSGKEPFDEWEDFALFASHYLVLVATNSSRDLNASGSHSLIDTSSMKASHSKGEHSEPSSELPVEDLYASLISFQRACTTEQQHTAVQPRRFGTMSEIGPSTWLLHGGYVDGAGESGRTNSSNLISSQPSSNSLPSPTPVNITPRMCHTMTRFGTNDECLLVGGRTSPNVALADCWLKGMDEWSQVESLPTPLYRHAAASISLPDYGTGVLIFGGRSLRGKAQGEWLIWQKDTGWSEVNSDGPKISPRFGACIATSHHDQNFGILVGGMSEDGSVLPESYKWEVQYAFGQLRIIVEQCSLPCQSPVHRVGATLLSLPSGYYLVGGFGSLGVLKQEEDIIRMSYDNEPRLTAICVKGHESFAKDVLLDGHHASYDGKGILIVGGGAVCFAFGAFWNHFAFRLDFGQQSTELLLHLSDTPSTKAHDK